jgi:hypothetical protein
MTTETANPATPFVSWAPEVIADGTGKWIGNQLRFATEQEAKGNVTALMMRWFAVRDERVVQSTDPVNATWDTVNGTQFLKVAAE